MKISWDNLLDRIKEKPLEHLGGFSPRLLLPYFDGYCQALSYHGKPDVLGDWGLWKFNRWFVSTAYGGPQGWASYCLLLTETDGQALELFFEFRRIAKDSDWHDEDSRTPAAFDISLLELLKSDSLRQRPAMYFGNSNWLPSIWAMWSGYVSAENDTGIAKSADRDVFVGFQEWLQQRYEFAQDANFGKLFEFLALNVQTTALESFFDHLELFLDGSPPDARTKKFQTFLDDAVASVLKNNKRENDELE